MSDRFCRIYAVPHAIDTLREILRHLERFGVHLLFPGSEHVIMLDNEGVQHPATASEVEASMMASKPISMQLWINSSHDVYCRLRKLDSVLSADLGMDGMTTEEMHAFVNNIVYMVRDLALRKMIRGLVVDCLGDFAEYDWDRMLVGGGAIEEPPVPTILGFIRGALDPEMCTKRGMACEISGDLVLLFSRGWMEGVCRS